MSTLHTVNKSPFEHKTLSCCARVCLQGDGILLIEDGVYGALASSPFAPELNALLERGVSIFVLEEDSQARGLKNDMIPKVQFTNYAGFARLSCEHKTIQSWY